MDTRSFYIRRAVADAAGRSIEADRISPVFRYETYADVQRNLTLITIALLTASVLFVDTVVLEYSILGPLAGQDPTALNVLSLLSLIVLSVTPVAVIAIDFIQFYQRLWDDKLVRWRDRFEDSFLRQLYAGRLGSAPLVQQILNEGDRRSAAARQQRRTLMRELWYRPFIDTSITTESVLPSPTSRQRFFQRLTIYWLTQVIEAVLLLLAVLLVLVRMARSVGGCDANDLLGRGLAPLLLLSIAILWTHAALAVNAREHLDQSMSEQIADLRSGGAHLSDHLHRAERALTEAATVAVQSQPPLGPLGRLLRWSGPLLLGILAIGAFLLLRQLNGFSC